MGLHDTIKIFADKIFAYREEMGITQEELADMLKLDNSYVSLLERGARIPSILVLDNAAKAFGVKPRDLLTESRRGERFSFRRKELAYIIAEAPSKKLDQIYRVWKTMNE